MKQSAFWPKRSALGALTIAVVSLSTGGAQAQEWMKDRQFREGAGVKAGDLELHPGIGAEIGYDSNYLLRSHKNGAANAAPFAPVEGAGMLRLTPSLSLSTIGPQRLADDVKPTPPTVKFEAGLGATYRHFFGAAIIEKQRNLSANANARLDIMPERPIGFGLLGNFERTIRPSVDGNPDLSFNRDDVGGGGEIITQPGGGTLDWRVGYGFRASLFEQSLGVPYNNVNHSVYTKGRWAFRPRTSLLYDADFRWLRYTEKARATSLLNDGSPARMRFGINGLVLPRLGVLAMAGYGASFFDNGNAVTVRQFDSVLAQAEVKFHLAAAPDSPEDSASLSISSVSVGYSRDFQTSFLGNFYGLDRGYVKFSYLFGGRFLLTAEGGLGAYRYPAVFIQPATQISDGFTDLRANASLFGEYRFTNSFGVNTTVAYSENFSDKQLPLGTAAPGTAGLYDLNWRRLEAFLGVRWFL